MWPVNNQQVFQKICQLHGLVCGHSAVKDLCTIYAYVVDVRVLYDTHIYIYAHTATHTYACMFVCMVQLKAFTPNILFIIHSLLMMFTMWSL